MWSTGGVGSNAIRAIADRPDLELVGVWVHTPEKVGRDAGELAGIAHLGIAATGDADELIALEPDCVVYAASGPERGAGAVPDYERLLEAGINVVTTTSTELVYPPVADEALRERLDKAAAAGDASLYASGIFPGFASDELALLLTTQSRNIQTLRLIEMLVERPLSSRRRDDGRVGLRSTAGLRALHRAARSHPHGVAGTDRAHRPRSRRRARRDSRSSRSPTHRPRHRSGLRDGPGGNRRCGSHDRERDRQRPARRSSSTTSSAWRETSRRSGRRRTTTPPTS